MWYLKCGLDFADFKFLAHLEKSNNSTQNWQLRTTNPQYFKILNPKLNEDKNLPIQGTTNKREKIFTQSLIQS